MLLVGRVGGLFEEAADAEALFGRSARAGAAG
jgi:hypothetical protein